MPPVNGGHGGAACRSRYVSGVRGLIGPAWVTRARFAGRRDHGFTLRRPSSSLSPAGHPHRQDRLGCFRRGSPRCADLVRPRRRRPRRGAPPTSARTSSRSQSPTHPTSPIPDAGDRVHDPTIHLRSGASRPSEPGRCDLCQRQRRVCILSLTQSPEVCRLISESSDIPAARWTEARQPENTRTSTERFGAPAAGSIGQLDEHAARTLADLRVVTEREPADPTSRVRATCPRTRREVERARPDTSPTGSPKRTTLDGRSTTNLSRPSGER